MNNSSDSLTKELRVWRVTPPPDPNFRARVWQRLDRRVAVTWPVYLRSHIASWSLATMLVVGVAAYAGSALARAHTQAARETIVVSYLVELDPRVQALYKP